jgi:hypothetical protein
MLSKNQSCSAPTAHSPQPTASLALCLSILASTGCGIGKPFHRLRTAEVPICDKPTQMLVTLTNWPLLADGEKVIPGVMARVYFFEEKQPAPVRVAADLEFAAYDHRGAGGSKEPFNKCTVAAAEMATHLRKDVVGESYLFWFACDQATSQQLVVNVTCRVKSSDKALNQVVAVDLGSEMSVTRSQTRNVNGKWISEPAGKPKSEPKVELQTPVAVAPQSDSAEQRAIPLQVFHASMSAN